MLDNIQNPADKKKLFQLTKQKLIMVEGTHEVSFFQKLLKRMNINDVQVKSVDGKHSFREELNTLSKVDNREDLTSLGLIRDADLDHDAAFKSLRDALLAANFPAPDFPMRPATEGRLSTFIFIMPGNGAPGALEDLCLASIDDTAVIACIDNYFGCLNAISGRQHPRLSKAKVQVYLSKHSTGDCSFARAADWDIWNWQSPAFETIRQFLASL